MIKPARLLDAAAGSVSIGEDDPPGYGRNGDNEGSAGDKQQGGVEHTRQKRQEVEQAKDKESAKHGECRPAGGPYPLPQQRRTSKAEPHRERRVGVG